MVSCSRNCHKWKKEQNSRIPYLQSNEIESKIITTLALKLQSTEGVSIIKWLKEMNPVHFMLMQNVNRWTKLIFQNDHQKWSFQDALFKCLHSPQDDSDDGKAIIIMIIVSLS